MRKPQIDADQALNLSQRFFGRVFDGAEALVGYDDANWLLTTASGNQAVLKVVNAMDSAAPGFCEAQGELLDFLAGQHGLPVPRPLPVLPEAAAAAAPLGSGGSNCSAPRPRFTAYIPGAGPSAIHAVRMLSFLPGELVRSCSEQDPRLYRSIGAFVARLDRALAEFDALPLHREHPWNLDCLPATWVAARRALGAASLPPGVDLTLLDAVVWHLGERMAAEGSSLRRQLVHSDANESNILVQRGEGGSWEVAGLIDFGDCCHQVLANEPAITAVYMALEHLRLGGAAPLDAVRAVLAGYQAQLPLLPPERRVLRTLMLGRLAMSLGLGVKAALEQPENAEYVLRTQHGGWMLLRLLWGMSDDAFAAAAGLT